MPFLRRVGAVYLIAVAVVVAVFFIVNTFLDDTLDVLQVWYVLDVLMLIALAVALIINYSRKMGVGGRDPEAGVTLRYLEVNVVFYVTAAVTILFLHNWFSLLAQGSGTAWTATTSLGDMGVRGYGAAARGGSDGVRPVAGGGQSVKADGLAPWGLRHAEG